MGDRTAPAKRQHGGYDMMLGCDPGLTGGVALYEWRSATVVAHRIPLIVHDGESGDHPKRIDTAQLWAITQAVAALDPAYCVLEDVNGRGGQGAASGFQFGKAAGLLEMAMVAAGVPVVKVAPSIWKRGLNVSAEKKLAVQRATELIPKGATFWPFYSSDDGLAEAALLAYYGAHVLGLDGLPSAILPRRKRKTFTPELLAGLGVAGLDPIKERTNAGGLGPGQPEGR